MLRRREWGGMVGGRVKHYERGVAILGTHDMIHAMESRIKIWRQPMKSGER